MIRRTRLGVLPLESRVTPSAPIPVGPEFRVNTTTAGSQFAPDVAIAPDGRFVVVWVDFQDQSGPRHAYGQRFSSTGVPQGNEFLISGMDLPAHYDNLHVAMDATGDFVVAWESNPHPYSLYARRYNAEGVPQGAEFPIQSLTSGTGSNQISLAMDADGNWAVVWNSTPVPPGIGQIYCRQFDSSGNPLAPEFLVDPSPQENQGFPKIAMAPNGEFVVAWPESARRFNSAGQALGPAFPIDFEGFYLDGLAIDSQGNFAVISTGFVDHDCFLQRYSSSGLPIGTSIAVNTWTSGDQNGRDIAMDPGGNFIVTWDDRGGLDGSGSGVFAQAFNSTGARVGSNFQVNSYTSHNQEYSELAMNAAGDIAVAWYSLPIPFSVTSPEGQDGSGAGVYAQRYRRGVPQVQSTQVNDGSAQRSRVTSLSVAFDTKVNFSGPVADAFTFVRNGGKPVSVSFTASAEIINGRTVVTLSSFTGGSTQFGSLADGRYTLTALAAQITDDYGQHLDGDGDLQQGGNYTFGDNQGLFRFFGDINGDRRVDIADYGLFSLSYLNQANYVAAFDFNGDGHIDIADYGQFGLRYLMPLP